jgi:hypothetical protein
VFLYTELAVVVNKYSISSGNALSTKVFFNGLRSESYRSADKSLARPTSRCILFDV